MITRERLSNEPRNVIRHPRHPPQFFIPDAEPSHKRRIRARVIRVLVRGFIGGRNKLRQNKTGLNQHDANAERL